MRPKRRFFFVAFAALVFATAAPDDTLGQKNRLALHGKVYLKKGDTKFPLADLKVALQNELGKVVARSSTDSGGKYTFYGQMNGKFTVVVVFRDESITKSVELKSRGDAVSKDFPITP